MDEYAPDAHSLEANSTANTGRGFRDRGDALLRRGRQHARIAAQARNRSDQVWLRDRGRSDEASGGEVASLGLATKASESASTETPQTGLGSRSEAPHATRCTSARLSPMSRSSRSP